jgi:hypothetical protein
VDVAVVTSRNEDSAVIEDGAICEGVSWSVEERGGEGDVRYTRPADGTPRVGFDSHASVTARG